MVNPRYRPGDVVQEVSSQSGEVAIGTTTIPDDDTIPQNTEGNQYFSVAMTPTSASNVLERSAQLFVTHSSFQRQVLALFKDSTASAVAAARIFSGTSNVTRPISIWHLQLAGTASSTTTNLRCGNSVAGTTTVNGQAGARLLGGALASYLCKKEIMA